MTEQNAYFWFDKHTSNGFILGFYEEKLVKILQEHIKAGSVFYDLGAHWGYFSILASAIVKDNGKVYSFEPIPYNFARLQKNIGINCTVNIEAFNLAISDKEGVSLFSNTEDSFANTYVDSESRNDGIQVTTIDLNSFISKNEARPPDFMKIDVEGAEMDVLNGGKVSIEKYRPVIHLSTHDKHVKGIDNKCRSWMADIGYEMNKISIGQGISDYVCMSR